MIRTFQSALTDIRAAFRLRRVWIALANEDIGDQHRRTTLGPAWLLINYLAFAGIFIFLFRRGVGDPNYPAYVATGLLVWLFISEVLTMAVNLFTREEGFIKGTTLPLSIYVMRLTMQSVVRTIYAVFGCVAILVFSGTAFSAGSLWSVLGLIVVFATAPAAIVIFAFAGAYFPDSQFIVGNLMRLGMFLTPIFWLHGGEGGIRGAFYHWNPFTYFVEIVREPILFGTFPQFAYLVCGSIFAVTWLMAIFLLGRLRKQVVFVL